MLMFLWGCAVIYVGLLVTVSWEDDDWPYFLIKWIIWQELQNKLQFQKWQMTFSATPCDCNITLILALWDIPQTTSRQLLQDSTVWQHAGDEYRGVKGLLFFLFNSVGGGVLSFLPICLSNDAFCSVKFCIVKLLWEDVTGWVCLAWHRFLIHTCFIKMFYT